jgi:hypothetical protein
MLSARRLIPHAFLLLFIAATACAQGPPSKEDLLNAVFDHVADSSESLEPKYYLAAEAAPCSFVKFDYDEWFKYALIETVPIGILNELAERSFHDRKRTAWQQGKLVKAICVGKDKEDSLLHALSGIYYFSRPVFTDDNVYALFDMTYRCDTRECGFSYTCLFRKTAEGWRLAGKMLRWRS